MERNLHVHAHDGGRWVCHACHGIAIITLLSAARTGDIMGGSTSSSSYQELRGESKSCTPPRSMQDFVDPFTYRPRMTALDWVKVRRKRNHSQHLQSDGIWSEAFYCLVSLLSHNLLCCRCLVISHEHVYNLFAATSSGIIGRRSSSSWDLGVNGDLRPLLASVCVIAFVVVGCVPWGMWGAGVQL